MVERIVRFSLEGLRRYKLYDYTGEGITQASDRYYSAYSAEKTSSLMQGINACLNHLINSNVDIKDLDKLKGVQELLHHEE